jgi:hypothetical protein
MTVLTVEGGHRLCYSHMATIQYGIGSYQEWRRDRPEDVRQPVACGYTVLNPATYLCCKMRVCWQAAVSSQLAGVQFRPCGMDATEADLRPSFGSSFVGKWRKSYGGIQPYCGRRHVRGMTRGGISTVALGVFVPAARYRRRALSLRYIEVSTILVRF